MRIAAVIVLLIIGLVGCGPPPAVRSLSQEQLSVQEAFAVSLARQFDTIAQFADVQVMLSIQRIDALAASLEREATAEAVDQLNTLAMLQADPQAALDDEDREALREQCPELATQADTDGQHPPIRFAQCRERILRVLAQQVRDRSTDIEARKARMSGYIQSLRERQQALIEAYMAIVEAQRTLNTYIQLQRADEVLMNELLGVVGLNQERINRLVDEIGGIVGEIAGSIEEVARQQGGQ